MPNWVMVNLKWPNDSLWWHLSKPNSNPLSGFKVPSNPDAKKCVYFQLWAHCTKSQNTNTFTRDLRIHLSLFKISDKLKTHGGQQKRNSGTEAYFIISRRVYRVKEDASS